MHFTKEAPFHEIQRALLVSCELFLLQAISPHGPQRNAEDTPTEPSRSTALLNFPSTTSHYSESIPRENCGIQMCFVAHHDFSFKASNTSSTVWGFAYWHKKRRIHKFAWTHNACTEWEGYPSISPRIHVRLKWHFNCDTLTMFLHLAAQPRNFDAKRSHLYLLSTLDQIVVLPSPLYH